MPNQVNVALEGESEPLDQVFRALADPTRRAVVQRLSGGPASVSELAKPFEMALPSFVQHLQVLEASGLIRSEKVGRVRICEVCTDNLQLAEGWMGDLRKLWEQRLDALAAYVEQVEQRRRVVEGEEDES
jgi:DNA-binding transcriptional ArsR family regulator